MPRSIPTSRRSIPLLPARRTRHRSAARRGAYSTTTVPRSTSPTTDPTHVLQPGPASTGRPTSLIRGIRGRAGGGSQAHEARPHTKEASLRSLLDATPPNQPGCSCNPGTPVPIKLRCPLHDHGSDAGDDVADDDGPERCQGWRSRGRHVADSRSGLLAACREWRPAGQTIAVRRRLVISGVPASSGAERGVRRSLGGPLTA
jgi:hypothetical protein